MPKIQTYVNHNVFLQINDLVKLRKEEGIEEATLSNVSSMLLELGLRVYNIQREKRENAFNQMAYNEMVLESILRVRAMCTEIMRMSALMPESQKNGNFKIEELEKHIRNYASREKEVFFPKDTEQQNE